MKLSIKDYREHAEVQKIKDELYKESVYNLRNDKSKRLIKVTKAGGSETTALIYVNLVQYTPLFQKPSDIITNKTIVNINHNVNTFDVYELHEAVPNFNNIMNNNFTVDNAKYVSNEDLEAMQAFVKDNLKNKPRYIVLFTIENPLTQVSYTVIADRYHGDLFYISGLGLLLSDDITVNPTKPFVIDGIKIGGAPVSPNSNSTDDIITVYNTVGIAKGGEFSITDMADDKGGFDLSAVKVVGVTFTRDLPDNIRNTNYPVFYDKLQHVNGAEIQLARQDTIPLMWVDLGTVKQFAGTKADIKLPNYLIYNSYLNNYRSRYNGSYHKPDTKFGVIIPLY